jgi:3-oxoacyl-[acyl-carrier protein] reductase
MDLGLRGRRAVITGASRGIGRAIAECLAGEGANLAICARGAEGVEAAKKDLEQKGVKVFAKSVDVANAEALKGFVAESAQALGGIDVLVSTRQAAPRRARHRSRRTSRSTCSARCAPAKPRCRIW